MKFNSSLFGVLLGTGQGGEGDAQRFIRTEAGQYADALQKGLGPRTEKQGNEKVFKAMRSVFFPILPEVKMLPVKARGHQSDLTWLFAGKKYLVGAAPEDVLPNASSEDMREIFKRANRSRGAAWRNLGEVDSMRADAKGKLRPHYKRFNGAQHAIKMNRIVVSMSAFKGLLLETARSVGQLKASLAYTANKLVGKNYPSWISRHFDTKANGRAIFDDSALNHPTNPTMVFGTSAKGVQSNPYIVDALARATEKRKHLIESKIRKVLKGYTYNWNTGQVFKAQVPEGGLPD